MHEYVSLVLYQLQNLHSAYDAEKTNGRAFCSVAHRIQINIEHLFRVGLFQERFQPIVY